MKKRLISLVAFLIVAMLVFTSCGDDELIASMQSQIDELTGKLEEANEEIKEKDDVIKDKNEDFKEKDAELKEKDEEISELEDEIAALKNQISTLQAEIKTLEAEKVANDEAIAKLESKHKAEIEALEAENAKLDLQIKALEERIQDLLNDKDYTVTFDVNGGVGDIPNQTVRYKKTVAEPVTPTKEHYDFLGWYVDGVKAEFPYVVTADTDFVAQYAPTKYTITYNVNGGTMPATFVSEYNVETSVTLPTPTRSLYLFEGWYENADFSGAKVTSIPVSEIGNKTYYAKWLSTTNGITYQLSNNGAYYIVTGYNGSDAVIVIPSSVDGIPVTQIAANAFKGKQKITSITVPDSVTSIGNYAFYDCISLTELNLGKGVKTIPSSMAEGCNKLASINIPDSVTSIGNYAFYNCTSLTSVVIPDSVTSIGSYAFSNCSSLTSVVIGDSVTSIGYEAFRNCSRLTSVYINDLSNWCNISFSDYYSNPLYYANNLYVNGELVTELVIPDSETSIGQYAFWNYDSLTSVVIPDSVTSIGSDAFYNCRSLTSVVIGDSVTSIGSYAFYGCSKLREVHNYSDLLIEKGSAKNGYVGYYAEVVINY